MKRAAQLISLVTALAGAYQAWSAILTQSQELRVVQQYLAREGCE